MNQLLNELFKTSENRQTPEEVLLEKCPFTRKSERKIEMKINLESFCLEQNISYAAVDKEVFREDVTLQVLVEKQRGQIEFFGQIPLEQKGKNVYFSCVMKRLDTPDSVKTTADKYKLMADEDTQIENDIKKMLCLFVKEKKFVSSVLYYVKNFVVHAHFEHRFTVAAKMDKGVKTFRTSKRALADAVTEIFDDLKTHLETVRLIHNSTDENYWINYAKSYVANEDKKKIEKKMKGDEEAKERMLADEKARADAAANLKLMLGRNSKETENKADSI